MEIAVEAAPAVWEMLKEIVDNLSEGADDVRNTLLKARSTTERLRSNISAMRCGDPGAARRGLREDAHVFVKVIHRYLIAFSCPQRLLLLWNDGADASCPVFF